MESHRLGLFARPVRSRKMFRSGTPSRRSKSRSCAWNAGANSPSESRLYDRKASYPSAPGSPCARAAGISERALRSVILASAALRRHECVVSPQVVTVVTFVGKCTAGTRRREMAAPELVRPSGGTRRLRLRRWWVRAGFTALFVVAFALGVWGFAVYRTDPDFAWGTTAWDVVYYSVQLFVLGAEATNDGGDLPWQLQAARFLAPVATGYAVFEAVRSLFADQFALVRTRRMRGHAVVVGRTPAADVIAEALAARGTLVVRTVTGSEEALRDAGIAGAAVLYACDAEDDEPGTNVLTVAVASRVDRAPDLPVLRLNAHVRDPELALALQARHLSHPQPGVDF